MTFQERGTGAGRAPLVTVVSGSGGVGKSTVCLLSAWLCASAGISTALVEADLQFGDMGYWLGLDDELPSLADGMRCEPVHLADKLALYKAPSLPEVAEDIADGTVHLVSGMRRAYDLVIADTGGFWSGLTAELACNASLLFNVMDARPASVMAAVRAQELCARIGIAASRCIAVYNRYGSRARLSEAQARAALAPVELHSIGEGRAVVDALLSSGSVDQLVTSGNGAVQGVDALLAAALPRVGVLYAGALAGSRRGLFR